MKYPKAAIGCILAVFIIGVALSLQKINPAMKSPRHELKDAPLDLPPAVLGGTVKNLREQSGVSSETDGVEGRDVGRFRYNLETGSCENGAGKTGLNDIPLREVIASKDGECVRFRGMISKPGGIHRDGDFDRLNFKGADFNEAMLNYVVINDADLRGAKMRDFQFGYGQFWGRIDQFSELPQGDLARDCRVENGALFCLKDNLGKITQSLPGHDATVNMASKRDCVLSSAGTKHSALQKYLGAKITARGGSALTLQQLISNEPFYIEGAESPGQFIWYYAAVEGPDPKDHFHYTVPNAANYYLSGYTDLRIVPQGRDGKVILFRILPESGGNSVADGDGNEAGNDFAIEFRCVEIE